MTNDDIFNAVADLIGEPFTPSRKQLSRMRVMGNTPAEIIDSLPAQIADLQHDVAKAKDGLEPHEVLPSEVAHMLYLHRAIRGFSSNRVDSKFRDLDPHDIYEIGYREGADDASDSLAVFYEILFDREPDAEGLAFYEGLRAQGFPAIEIAKDMIKNGDQSAS